MPLFRLNVGESLTLEKKKILLLEKKNSFINNSNHIGIIRIPELVLEPFENLGVGFVSTSYECQYLTEQPTYKQAIDILVKYLLSFSLTSQDFNIHHLTINSVGLRTVTYDRQKKNYIGLHLDSWDKLSLEKRHLSTNRICINLGLEDRYFLFINLTLMDMFNLVKVGYSRNTLSCQQNNSHSNFINNNLSNSLLLNQIPPNAIRQMFLERYPNYPVVKVRVSPGEAYIAPTENMIHDASTLDKRFFDVILTIRGHLKLP